MTRPVDANELVQYAGEACEYRYDCKVVSLDDIMEASLIDAAIVVHGRWYGGYYDDNTGLLEKECSACNHTEERYPIDWEYVKYCSYCGAMMDLTGDEDEE